MTMPVAKDPGRPDERETYLKAGCAEIWDYLAAHMHFPPSFEVFRHGYMNSMCADQEEYANVLIRALKK